ncbi:LIC_10091 family lipoprotein, partial [Leptospira santarosai]
MFHSKMIPFVLTGFIVLSSFCKTPAPKDFWIVPPLEKNEKLFLDPLKIDEFNS